MTTEPRGTSGARAVVAMTMVASGVSQGFGRFSYALAIPALVRTSLHSIALAGTLGTINVAFYLLGSILVSLAATRYRPDHLMRIGLAGSTAGLLVLCVAPNLMTLILGMVLAGTSGAFVWVPAPAIAGASVEPRLRGLVMGITGAGIGIFITLSSVISYLTGSFAGSDSWRALFGIEGLIALGVFILSMRFLRAPLSMPRPAGRAEISSLKKVPGWIGLVGSYSAFGLTNALFITFAVSALEKDSHFGVFHASFEFALMGFVSIFGGILIGRISDSRGRVPVMLANFLMMAAATLLVVAGREPYALLGMMLYGIPSSGVPNTVVAILGDKLPARSVAAAFGSVTIFFGIFQAVAPQIGGAMAQSAGSFDSVYLLAGAVALLGFGFAYMLAIANRGDSEHHSLSTRSL